MNYTCIHTSYSQTKKITTTQLQGNHPLIYIYIYIRAEAQLIQKINLNSKASSYVSIVIPTLIYQNSDLQPSPAKPITCLQQSPLLQTENKERATIWEDKKRSYERSYGLFQNDANEMTIHCRIEIYVPIVYYLHSILPNNIFITYSRSNVKQYEIIRRTKEHEQVLRV